MTLLELYQIFTEALQGTSLIIRKDMAEYACRELLVLAGKDEITIDSPDIRLYDDCVTVCGAAVLAPYTSIGQGQITLTFFIEKQEHPVSCEAKIAVSGCGPLKDFMGQLPVSKIRGEETDCLFSGFLVRYPTLLYHSKHTNDEESPMWEVSGMFSPPHRDDRWNEYAGLFAGNASFQGKILNTGITETETESRTEIEMDFIVQRELSLPFGTASANLAMRTVYEDLFADEQCYAKAYLLYRLPFPSSGQTVVFQSELFRGDKYQSGAVFCDLPLSLQNIAGFMQEMFRIGQEQLLLPKDTALSAFGLSQLQITFEKKGTTIFDGMHMKRIFGVFSLGTPLSLQIPGLLLEQFRMVWEISWDAKKHSFVTLSAVAKAALDIGSYRLTGTVTGDFPAMNFSGSLSLQKKMTLTDFAAGYGVGIPSDWQGERKELAGMRVAASARNRLVSVEASVSDVIALPVGTAVFSMEQLRVYALLSPENKNFGIEGILAWKPEDDDAFAFSLTAGYIDNNWIFQGGLAYGRVKIGNLLRQLFHQTSSASVADLELSEFSISYSMADKKFTLYASCEVSGIEMFGIKPRLGGRIRLEKASQLSASLAMYLEIDAFRLLVQANDFYDEDKRSFLFRVEFRKQYMQAVYQKSEEGEILTVSLGNMTFGDILLALIHLVNPNAVQTLSAPWNILNEIQLADFQLAYNITKKSVSFLYHLNWKLAGFIEIDDIGLSYSKEEGVRYILTGRLFHQTQTQQLTWDAIHENPPAQAADSEVKLNIYYIGIGNHLDLCITKNTIPDILQEVRQQLVPNSGVPGVGIRQDSGWMLGFDFMLSDLFRIRTLLYSPKLYGAMIEVQASQKSPLAMFNGLLLELFYKKISDSTGMFHCRLAVPKRFADFTLGMIEIHLGEFLLEVYTNGSFYLDLGFPHQQDFSRSFGLSYGIFGGRGGFYFGVLTGDAVHAVPAAENGIFSPVVRIGIGLSVGLARSFDLGIVKGGVSLTLTGIFEGAFAVFKPEKQTEAQALYYRVKAVAGIHGSLFLSVDLKIITVSASAEIAAFCELEIESYRQTVVALDLDMKLSASMKIIFFKISFSFHFHHRAVFAFGSDQTAPWEKVPQKRYVKRNAVKLSADASMKVGSFRIAPVISPVISVDFSGNERTFCLTFLTVIRREDMQSVFAMLLYWIFAHITGSDITVRDMEQITDKRFADSLTYENLLQLLSANMTVMPKPADLQEQENTQQGIIFPMLPQLTLSVDDAEIDFSKAKISEADMEEISRYFYRLNADPVYGLSREKRAAGEEIPLCGALLADWFHMALEEIQGRIGALFETVLVRTGSFDTVIEKYGGSLKAVLNDQPDLLLYVPVIPEHPVTVLQADSLYRIADQINEEVKGREDSSEKILWDVVKKESVFCDDIKVDYSGYQFDNGRPGLTLEQAGAVFYVRMFDPDVIYAPYAEYILKNNPVDLEWECRAAGEREFKLPAGSYMALSGDTVIRIAKMLYLLDHRSESDHWTLFRTAFIQCNGKTPEEKPGYCRIPEGYTGRITGYYSGCRLFCACYPDFFENPWTYPLWRSAVLRPMTVITLKNARIERTATVAEFLKSYRMESLIQAIEEYGAQLSGEQEVEIKKPCRIPKAELEARILTDSIAEQTGSMLSRVFLQGARPPAPVTHKETPLYQLLGQQIPWQNTADQLTVSIRCPDASADWIMPDTEEKIWTGIGKLMPDGELIQPDAPVQMPSLHSHSICWSVMGGEEVLNGAKAEWIVQLPKDCIEYMRTYGELPDMEQEETTACFCTMLSLEIRKQSAGIYGMYGAAAADRERLYQLAGADVSRLRLLYAPSKLDAARTGLAQLFYEECLLIQTNFSKETHHVFSRARELQNENPYIASITECGKFLTLLWKCSVIGGGFWLCHDKDVLPDTVFDENGRAELFLLADFIHASACAGVVNALSLPEKNTSVVLSGNRETAYDPVFPRGCAGFRLACPYSEDNAMQSLYQLLSYRVYDRQCSEYVESAPILPMHESDSQISYQAAVPLWKLENPAGNFYAAVGKQFTLNFELRDVLGNTAAVKNGEVSVTGEYNDNLIALHELPDTRFRYCFVQVSNQPAVKITGEYIGVQQEHTAAADADRAKADTAEIARQQHGCADIRLTAEVSLSEQIYVLDEAVTAALRAYENVLCHNLNQGMHTAPAPIEMVLPVTDSLPEKIVPLTVRLTIERESAMTKSRQVNMAESVISADSDKKRFTEGFEAAFPGGYRLACDSTQAYYYVPLQELVGKIAISPYTYQTGRGEIRSSEFVAFTPFANTTVTKDAEVTAYGGKKEVRSFINIDANVWEQQFLSDIENLLQAELAVKAARQCPDQVRQMADAKKELASKLAKRLLPVRTESADIPMEQVWAFAEDKLLRNLCFACDMGVMLIYHVSMGDGGSEEKELIRFEAGITMPQLLTAGKVSSQSDIFCLLLTGSQFKDNDLADRHFSRHRENIQPDVCLCDLEYDIVQAKDGYERSKWLRFENPIVDKDAAVSIDLSIDAGIPFPRRECPRPPVIQRQSCEANKDEFLYWDWSGEIVCGAYEQYTVCVRLDVSKQVLARSRNGRGAFEVMADYFCKREQLWKDLETEGNFRHAYQTIAELADAFAKDPDLEPMRERRSRLARQPIEFQIVLCFDQEGNPHYTVLQSKECEDFLKSMNARIGPVEAVAGGKKEGTVTFRLNVSHLSAYRCSFIKPSAWMVQNDNLLIDTGQTVREEFIFRTETVSLPGMRVYLEYRDPMKLAGDTLEEALMDMWNILQISDSATVNICAFFKRQIHGRSEELFCRIPITFQPDAQREHFLANLTDWCERQEYLLSHGGTFSFEAAVYPAKERETLIFAKFEKAYGSCPERV